MDEVLSEEEEKLYGYNITNACDDQRKDIKLIGKIVECLKD